MDQENNNERLLFLYEQLINGLTVKSKEMAVKFKVSERSIRRDIKRIRDFVERKDVEIGKVSDVIYDREENGYRLKEYVSMTLSNAEVLAVCKILLDSRAFTRIQMNTVLDKLLECCLPEENQKMVKELLANERYHYIELSHKPASLDILWEIGRAVKESWYLELEYYRPKDSKTVVRKVKPVALMFSEYYFYLAAYITDTDSVKSEKTAPYKEDPYPTIYRVDRIQNCRILEEHFKIPYKDRFEEGEFRKRIQFMYGGKLKRIRFKYVGYDVSAILDKLPTAKVLFEDEEGWEIQAEVFGDGIDMWLRSQGEWVKEISSKVI